MKKPSFERNTQSEPDWLNSVSDSQYSNQTRAKSASQVKLTAIFNVSLKISLTPLIIAVFFVLKEWQTIIYLDKNGVASQAIVLDLWIDGQRWKNYFVRYELELIQPEGEVKRIIHEEELTVSHYHELQPGNFLTVHYVLDNPPLIRSERIALNAFKLITTLITTTGVLFLSGWSALLAILVKKLGQERWYSKYMFFSPLLGYIGIFAEIGAMGLARNYHFPFLTIFLVLGTITLLIIGDIFRISWLTDFKPRH
jgi:hypothetical protein